MSPQMKTIDGLYATLTGLQPYSSYRLRVEAATRMGNGPSSQPITCLTDEAGKKTKKFEFHRNKSNWNYTCIVSE